LDRVVSRPLEYHIGLAGPQHGLAGAEGPGIDRLTVNQKLRSSSR
jgi:hypothetical protein